MSDTATAPVEVNDKLTTDRERILAAKAEGVGATLGVYARLSGPGWLQSAITLGGGSLAGSLYLGVIGGYQLMWLQPLMMILGIVMLSAISYVALSTGRRPFEAINTDINPVLGWGWAIATLMANLVWAMPQFSLGTAALQQNLLPGVLGAESSVGAENGKYLAVAFLFFCGAAIVWFYDSGGWGIRLFDIVLKLMVGVVVVSFFGVVVAMSLAEEGLPWGEIFGGFIPNPKLLFQPADKFISILGGTSDPKYWEGVILHTQRDRMVTAAATAVGINMTFLLPYSMLKRGWDKDFRGMATFDLSTGLLVPFVLATSCVVIASASQFHAKFDQRLIDGDPDVNPGVQKSYDGNLNGIATHLAKRDGDESERHIAAVKGSVLTPADRQLSAMLIKRDAFQLANALESLTGKTFSQTVFGVGVLGMAVSTIIILMLINGFTICEICGVRSEGPLYRLGCVLPGITGGLGYLFLWTTGANFWLAVPTSVFGMVLLPIAYTIFFLMMNNHRILGKNIPTGGRRLAANLAMLTALLAATIGAAWSIWGRAQLIPGTSIQVRWAGIVIVVLFVAAALLVQLLRPAPKQPARA